MKDNEEKNSRCPVRHVLSLFSDKWSLLVLCHLHIRGTMRFGELASAMTDISERVLTVRLKNLIIGSHSTVQVNPISSIALQISSALAVPSTYASPFSRETVTEFTPLTLRIALSAD